MTETLIAKLVHGRQRQFGNNREDMETLHYSHKASRTSFPSFTSTKLFGTGVTPLGSGCLAGVTQCGRDQLACSLSLPQHLGVRVGQ